MTSDWVSVVVCVIFLGVALRGVHMLARPARYLGMGIIAAHDPRTVRFFGGLHLFFGAVVVLLLLVRIAR